MPFFNSFSQKFLANPSEPISTGKMITQTRNLSWNIIQILLSIVITIIYGVLFYKMWTNQLAIDFYAFHGSSAALFQGDAPYPQIQIPYFSEDYTLGANLNAPVFLMLFWPLSRLNYHEALVIWSASSFILGLLSASIAFKLAFSAEFIKQYQLTLYIIYLFLFSTLVNIEIAQIGTYVAFFIISGYSAYRKNRYILAGVLWGVIISIKLFPGLLFFYVLKQRQYKMLAIMGFTVILMSLIPALTYGSAIYSSYFQLLPQIPWYGDSWNASLYGFLFRLFVDSSTLDHQRVVQFSFSILALGCLIWYLKQIYSIQSCNDTTHQEFCLTLVMMLLISPFGWIYYFPLLLFPLLNTWSQATRAHDIKDTILWFMCLLLMNFPIWNIHESAMGSLTEKLSIDSFWFYGLVLLAYILSKNKASSIHQIPSI